MPRMRRTLVLLAWTAGTLAAGYGLYVAFGHQWLERPTSSGGPPPAEGPRAVVVAKARRTTVERRIELPATIEAFEQAEIFAKTSGYLGDVRADIGDRVDAHALLAVIDAPEVSKEIAEANARKEVRTARAAAARAATHQAERAADTAKQSLERAKADLALQNATLKRKETLFAERTISDQEIDDARNRHDVAEADVRIAGARIEQAKAEVGSADALAATASAEVLSTDAEIDRLRTLAKYLEIRAPFAGVVVRRFADRGDFVQAATLGRSSPLFTLQRDDVVRIVVHVPERESRFVTPGSKAKVFLWRDGSVLDSLDIRRTASALDPATRTLRAEIEVQNGDHRLAPGTYARATIVLESRKDVLAVPRAAMLGSGTDRFVFVVLEGCAERRPVTAGLDNGSQIEVGAGLDEETQVIVSGQNLLHQGTPVHVQDR